MFSLLDLRFVLCSLDLAHTTCAKDHGLSYPNYPQINEVGKSDVSSQSERALYVVYFINDFCLSINFEFSDVYCTKKNSY